MGIVPKVISLIPIRCERRIGLPIFVGQPYHRFHSTRATKSDVPGGYLLLRLELEASLENTVQYFFRPIDVVFLQTDDVAQILSQFLADLPTGDALEIWTAMIPLR